MGSGSGGWMVWSTVGRGACEEPARKPQASLSPLLSLLFQVREGLCSELARARSFPLDWPERKRELIGR
jgi:hypothetical protein